MIKDSIINTYPEFSSFKHSSKEKIVKFIQLAYCKESPLAQDYPSLDKRVAQALIAAGLDEKFDIENESITNLIDIYLEDIQSSNEFSLLVSFQKTLREAHILLRKPVEGLDDDKTLKAIEAKNKIINYVEGLSEKINQLYKNIYHNDAKLINKAEKKIRRITPELIAQQNK